MNAHLLQVDAALATRLRGDPELVERLALAHSLDTHLGFGADLGDDLDGILAEHLPSILWGWWPATLRRHLARRFVARLLAGGASMASAHPAAAELDFTASLATMPAVASVGGGSWAGYPTYATMRPVVTPPAHEGRVIELKAVASSRHRPPSPPPRDDGASIVTFPAVAPGSNGGGPPSDGAAVEAGPAPALPAVGENLSLSKDWHVVHYLLAGSPSEAPPGLGAAVLGGDQLGADFGYGPSRLLDADEVRAVAAAFRATPPAKIAKRWDDAAFTAAALYGAGAVGRRSATRHLRDLDAFYQRSARGGKAVLAWLI